MWEEGSEDGGGRGGVGVYIIQTAPLVKAHDTSLRATAIHQKIIIYSVFITRHL